MGIAGRCPIGDWHPNIGDPALISDRLFHNAYKMEPRGDSMGKSQGEPTAVDPAAGQRST